MSEPVAQVNPRTEELSPRQRQRTIQIIAIVAWILTILSNLRYNFGRRSPWDHGHQDDVGFTPFTASLIPILLLWFATVVVQGVYLLGFFDVVAPQYGIFFIINNCALLLWSYLFARSHYILAELVIILNLFNLSVLFVLAQPYRLRPLAKFLGVHGAVFSFPFAWSFYLLFWNGAVLFGARNIMPRLLANLLIWAFLFIPVGLVVLFGDYVTGFVFAWITFALGLGQLFTKVFALQWIFAFTIATALLVVSLAFAFVAPPQVEASSNEQAPLLTEP